MAGEKRKREQKVGGAAAGALVVVGTLLAAALAAAWAARGIRRRRKDKEEVDSKEDFDLVPTCTSPLPNHEHDISSTFCKQREFDAEDADVTQRNGSISDILEQDQKTGIGGRQINLAKAIIEVQGLASSVGDRSSEIEVLKDNNDVIERETLPISSEVDVEELTYKSEEIEYETSPSQNAEEIEEIGEETLPILYEEEEDSKDNVVGIEHETSLTASESRSESESVEEEEEEEVSSVEEDNKGDEKSEISRDSSSESNTVAVWPTEMVEEHDLPPLEPVEMKISNDKLHKMIENSHILFQNEDKLMAIKPKTTTTKDRRLDFDNKTDSKGLLLMLVLALAIGIFSFVHHHQLAYVYEQFFQVLFPLQNNAF